jgi:hypothetical protein
VLFGGRIAEELFMNQMTTGASNDFERATHIARDMVTRYGMSDLMGPMVYGENEGEVFLGRSITRTVNMSEETMRKVDSEIRKIIDQQYAVARKLLEEPGQGRGDGEGAARMGNHRFRADRRHHGRQAAASAEAVAEHFTSVCAKRFPGCRTQRAGDCLIGAVHSQAGRQLPVFHFCHV